MVSKKITLHVFVLYKNRFLPPDNFVLLHVSISGSVKIKYFNTPIFFTITIPKISTFWGIKLKNNSNNSLIRKKSSQINKNDYPVMQFFFDTRHFSQKMILLKHFHV